MAGITTATHAGDVRMWDLDTSAWTTNFNDTDSLEVLESGTSSPHLAIDGKNRLLITYEELDRNYILRHDGTHVVAWDEGSTNWVSDLTQGTYPIAWDDAMFDSRLVADGAGTGTLVGMQKHGSGYDLFAARITDDAVTVWDTLTSSWILDSDKADPITHGSSSAYLPSQALAVDTNNQTYLVYPEHADGGWHAWFTRINDSGVSLWDHSTTSWSTDLTVGTPIDQGSSYGWNTAIDSDSSGKVYIMVGYDSGTYLQQYDGTDLKAWDTDTSSWSTTLSDGNPLDRGNGSATPQLMVIDGNDDVYMLTKDSNEYYLNRYDGTDVHIWNQEAGNWTTNFSNGTPFADDIEQMAANPQGGVYFTSGSPQGMFLLRCTGSTVEWWDQEGTNWTGISSNATPFFSSQSTDHTLAVDGAGRVYLAHEQYDGVPENPSEVRLLRHDGTELRTWDCDTQGWIADLSQGDSLGHPGKKTSFPTMTIGSDNAVYTMDLGYTPTLISGDEYFQPLLARYKEVSRATIAPNWVLNGSSGQQFAYEITADLEGVLSVIDQIEITVPEGYTNAAVTSVKINGMAVAYTDHTSGNDLAVTLSASLTVHGTVVEIGFTADTPTQVTDALAFPSTVDNGAAPNPQSCEPLTGDLVDGTWSVVTSDSGAATAEISPVSVGLSADDQTFSYYVTPVAGLALTQVDQVEISVPAGYSDVTVTGVQVGGSVATYSNSSSGNEISITLDTPVPMIATVIRVDFTADTPPLPARLDFTSTIDDTAHSNPGDAASGDGDNGGAITTDRWTVFANGPVVTSADAEIHPVSVAMGTRQQPFSYYINPVIGPHDSGFDVVEITLPVGYENAALTGVSLDGSPVGYTDSSVEGAISVHLDSRVTVSGMNVRIDFTVDAPAGVDWGQAVVCVLKDDQYYNAVNCSSGDGSGSVATDSWTIRTVHTTDGVFTQNSWPTGQFDAATTNIYSTEETHLFLASDPTDLVLIHEFLGNQGAETEAGHDRIYDLEIFQNQLYMTMCAEPMWSVWGHIYSYDGQTNEHVFSSRINQGFYRIRTIGDYLWMPSSDFHSGPELRRFDGESWEDIYVMTGLGWQHHLDIANYKGRNYVTMHDGQSNVYSFDDTLEVSTVEPKVEFRTKFYPYLSDLNAMIVFHGHLYVAPGSLPREGDQEEHYIRMIRHDGTDHVVFEMDRTNAPPRDKVTSIQAFETFKDELYFTTWDSVYRFDEETEDATRIIKFPDATTVHAIKEFEGRLYATVRVDPLKTPAEGGHGGPDAHLFFNFAGLNRIDDGEVWRSDENGENWERLPVLPVDITYALETWRGRLFVGGGYEYYTNPTEKKAKLFGSKIAASGTLVSKPYDTGFDHALYGQIFYEGEMLPQTTLRFQLRTALTEAGLSSATFVGPDGTANTYYTTSGTMLSSSHTGERWFQYAAYLDTSDTTNQTPILESVSIVFGDGVRVENRKESSVTSTSATLNGEVLLVDNSTDRIYLCWGDEDGGTGSTGDWDHVIDMGTGWTPGSLFSTNVTISAGTVYYYRAYISSAGDDDWANTPEVFTYNQQLPFVETFETDPAVMAGAQGAIDGQHGWAADAGAVVQDDVAWEFNQAAELNSAALRHGFEDGQTGVWSVFATKWVLGGIDYASIPANATVIFWANEGGTLSAYDGQTPIDTGVSLNTSKWVRVQMQSDYVAKQWSLWVDGEKQIDHYGFYSPELSGFTRVGFRSYDESTLYVDDVRIGTAAWNPKPGDTDGDGLDDNWEVLYFNSPNILTSRTGNLDGDELTDGEEEIAGTDPTDPDSVFSVSENGMEIGDNFIIRWPSAGGRLYSVDSLTNLVTDTWSNMATNLPATPPENVYTVQVDNVEKLFNRVRVRKE